MTARDLFTESNAVPVELAGTASSAATGTPAGAGCCGKCGKWTERPTGFGNCEELAKWHTMSPKAACTFEPSRWSAISATTIAKREAQAGIDQAAAAADRVMDGWTLNAFEFVKRFAEENRGRQYLGQEIVRASLVTTLPQPPNPKAWGQPIQRAVRAGLIRKAGYAPDPHRHNNPVPIWETV